MLEQNFFNRRTEKYFVFSVILTIILSNFALAQKEEVFFDEPQITPENKIQYKIKIFLENLLLKINLSPDKKTNFLLGLIEKRMSDANEMIEKGNYIAAKEAIEQSKKKFPEIKENFYSTITTKKYSVENLKIYLDNIIKIESKIVENKKRIEAIHLLVGEKVENKEIDETTAASLINDIRLFISDLQREVQEAKNEIAEKIVDKEKVSYLEVEEIIREKEKSFKTDKLYDKIDNNKITVLNDAITEIRDDVAKEKSKNKETQHVEFLLGKAELYASMAEYYLDKDKRKAFAKFTDAENLVLKADNLLKNPDYELEEKTNIIKETKIENEKVLLDFEKLKEDSNKNELAKKIEKDYKKAKQVVDASKKLKVYYDNKKNEIKEKVTDANKIEILLGDDLSKEYSHLFGKVYLPPGFIAPRKDKPNEKRIKWESESGELQYEGFEEGGGFLKYFDYTDGIYKFKFETDKYSFTTPAGLEYDVLYPSYYSPKIMFENGDEKLSFATKNGHITYTTLGYLVDDGEKIDKYNYEKGVNKLIDGGEIKIKPFGFSYQSNDGKISFWTYSPKYQNYYNPISGKIIKPSTSPHKDNTIYQGEAKYAFIDEENKVWIFDSKENTWSTDTDKILVTTAPAPIGYEKEKKYTTPEGEEWIFSTNEGWKSSSGITYLPSPQNYFNYNEKENAFIDLEGNKISTEEVLFMPYKEKRILEIKDGNWVFSDGETYDPLKNEIIVDGKMKETEYGVIIDKEGKRNKLSFEDGYYIIENGIYKFDNPYYDYAEEKTIIFDHYGNKWELNKDGTWKEIGGGIISSKDLPFPKNEFAGYFGRGIIAPQPKEKDKIQMKKKKSSKRAMVKDYDKYDSQPPNGAGGTTDGEDSQGGRGATGAVIYIGNKKIVERIIETTKKYQLFREKL